MPIKGLTTNRGAAFPKIGILRKGAEKPQAGNRPGADLEYFRFDTEDQTAAELFRAEYGDEPNDISVYLPYAEVAQNFDAWKEAWLTGGLLHRCDGETTVRIRLKDGTYSSEPHPCPGGCKAVGRLAVIIPALKRLAYVTVQTTSVHDVIMLQENLSAAYLLRNNLQGIPFVLSRRAREISMPDGKGGRVRRVKWLLQLEPDPQWVELQLAATAQAALPTGDQHARLLTAHDDPDYDPNQAQTESGETDESPPDPESQPTLTAQQRVTAIRVIRQLMASYAELSGEQSPNLAADLERLPDPTIIEIGAAERKRVADAHKAHQERQATAQASTDPAPTDEDEGDYDITDGSADGEPGAVYNPATAVL